MKTIASFNKPMDAHLLVARLEGSGIQAFTRDENMVTLDWVAANAIGGVKVDVADDDFGRAMELMGVVPDTEAKAACGTHGKLSHLFIAVLIAATASIAYGSIENKEWTNERLVTVVAPSIAVAAIAYALMRVRNKT